MACDYVYNVFNFENAPIVLSHLLGDILYFYAFFLICYYTKFKYLTLIFLFMRGLFFGIYTVLLVCVSAFGGVLVVVFVFVPATLISIAVCFVLGALCSGSQIRYAFLIPAVLAVIDCIVMLLLVNVLFRVVIIIV